LSLTTQTGRALRGIVRLSCAKPRITVLLAVLLDAVSVAHAVRHLGFKTDQAGLLPRSTFIERYKDYERRFGDLDDLVIVVDARSLPEAQAYAARLVRELDVDDVVFAYSDVSHLHVMHVGSTALAAGANYVLLGPDATMLEATVPVVAVCAVRTGSGKSQTTRRVVAELTAAGKTSVVVRHPMPYGNLVAQRVQRFAGA